MTLPASGPLSLNDIQGEFGGTNPISLSEYYGVDTGVPASGTISIDDFYGTSAGVDAQFDLATYNGVDTDSFAPRVDFDMTNAFVARAIGGSTSTIGVWDNAGTITASDWEVRLTRTGFTGSVLETGTFGSWLGLGTSRTWGVQTAGASGSWTGTMEIRRASDSVVVDSATFSATLTYTGGGGFP